MGGEIILELTSADIPGVLDTCAKAGITILELTPPRGLSVRIRIRRQDLTQMQEIAEKRGDSLRQVIRLGIYWDILKLSRHWLALAGIIGILLLSAWLPTRVLFIRVEGNTRLPSRMILEKAADCGIVFGADRGEIRSERMKNALLDAVPQLQWAGVNTVGCTALITVEERSVQENAQIPVPGNIVAECDGILEEITVVRGTGMKKPGQVVRAGEVLISGYTDCGGVILFSGAQGEAYARTMRKISAVTTDFVYRKSAERDSKTKFSLVIGKNRINFYEDSGILDTGCVKMYSENYLTLPGGLVLPIRLIIQTEIPCLWTEESYDSAAAEGLLEEQSSEYLSSQMIAGQILSVKPSATDYQYYAEYVCREMIGRLIHEEIVQSYGENRRTTG